MDTTKPSALAELLARAANIPPPWRATRCHVDAVGRMVHLWVTRHPVQQVIKKRNWLGITTVQAASPPPPEGPDLHWRHLNCMDFTCTIHTTDRLDPRHHDLPWFGQKGLPFSNGLSKQVFTCLVEGLEFSAICTLLNVTFADLWRFKYGLDNGLVKFDYVATRKTGLPGAAAAGGDGPADAQMPAAAPLLSDSGVPDASSLVWERLLTGTLVIETKTLGFQLILTKLRQQVSVQQTDDVKLLKVRELHRYVERNARGLDVELQQLRSHALAEA